MSQTDGDAEGGDRYDSDAGTDSRLVTIKGGSNEVVIYHPDDIATAWIDYKGPVIEDICDYA